MAPAIIGTRGQFSLSQHENVIPSLVAAPAWADGIYVNVRMSSDGEPVLMHDTTVDRTTNGTGAVSSLTLAQIQALDAGDGAQVPTLQEYLEAIRDIIDVEAAAGDRRPFSRIFINPRNIDATAAQAIHDVAYHASLSDLHDRYMWTFGSVHLDSDDVDAFRSVDATAPVLTMFADASELDAALTAADGVDASAVLIFPQGYNADRSTVAAVVAEGHESGITRAQESPHWTQTAPIAWQDGNVSIVFTPEVDKAGWWHASDPQDQRPMVVAVISGSHIPAFEARILVEFQTTDDPDGTTLPIVAGDVQYDATADVFATLSLTTLGVDEQTGRSLRPRRASDLLAPYGRELWVRRGIDLGSEVLWVPLGLFRITDVEQPDAPDGPITLSGQDRMRGIIRARLISPRAYDPDTTVGDVAEDLVVDVYPDAVIAWDDATNAEPVGRQLVVEQDRYAALREIADAYGKIMYWDGLGILRIEDPPDADDIVWEVRAGRAGVLVQASDAVSDQDSFNAVVVTGEGVSGLVTAARGVAVDQGATSPTRFGGPYGKVPDFFASPLVLSDGQARTAAIARLRRNMGMTHVASFGAIVNPLLRPRQAIRLTLRDGNREKHIMERVTVPLVADATMDGVTREQTRVVVGAVVA